MSHVELVHAIHSAGRSGCLALTGGGSGAVAALLQTPGASRSILEVRIPYHRAALADLLGQEPEQFCGEATALAMSMVAWMRARALAPTVDPARLVGLGATASLSSDRPKRGSRRLHVAVQAADRTAAASLAFDGASPSRELEEEAATQAVLAMFAEACGVDVASSWSSFQDDLQRRGVTLIREQCRAPAEWSDLVLGRRGAVAVPPAESPPAAASTGVRHEAGSLAPQPLLIPGAFNPVHAGHLALASVAEKRLGRPATWELSLTNVAKPPLDFLTLGRRVAALQAASPTRIVALTAAPTFCEKARLFPGATFAVGVDTISRVADPNFYGNDPSARDRALAELRELKCRFLVFGRVEDSRFLALQDVDLPAALTTLCDGVSEAEFRSDLSSTALRRSSTQTT